MTEGINLKKRSELKLSRPFYSAEEIQETIKEFNVCQAQIVTLVSDFINGREDENEICTSVKAKKNEMSDEEILANKKIIWDLEKEFSQQNIEWRQCTEILCDSVQHKDIDGKEYDSWQECVSNSYGCGSECTGEYNSPVSEEELLAIVASSFHTEEGIKTAAAYRSFCGGAIDDGKDGFGALLDTVFETLCIDCMGAASKELGHNEL